MANIQPFLIECGYIVSEAIRGVNKYHLDDRPNLESGPVVMDRVRERPDPYGNKTFTQDELKHLYGSKTRLVPEFISEDGEPEWASGEAPT